jgi:hypothetical protein
VSDVLSLSKEQVAATSDEPQADMTLKQPMTDYATLLARRSSAPIACLMRSCPSRTPREYADDISTPDRSEQELLVEVGTTSGSA